jgi:hypothetical protein
MLAAALLLMSGASRDANAPLSLVVTPMQSFAPTTLTVRAHVQPDDANRALDVAVESGSYYRSSRIPLDGAGAPPMISVQMRNMPGGEYEVTGALINAAGHELGVVHAHVVVIDNSADPE